MLTIEEIIAVERMMSQTGGYGNEPRVGGIPIRHCCFSLHPLQEPFVPMIGQPVRSEEVEPLNEKQTE